MNSKIKLLPHNEKLYSEIKQYIDAGERSIFYSEATGLGKSYIFMRLVEEYFSGKSILYIVPKIAIWENLVHYNEFSYLNAKIKMMAFAAFNAYDSEDCIFDNYDVVFVDECHHMLSDIQGSNVAKLLQDMVNSGKYTFGMTATPRYEDIYVDEKYFNVSCYGYDVFEAIDNQLFPKIDIAVADIDFSSVPEDLRVRFSVDGTRPILEQIINERKDITHWLAYFSNSKDLRDNEAELRKLFPDFKIIKLYQGNGNAKEVIRNFEEYDGKIILMSISMLLEGMHLDNVGGVLLYRNVGKATTYFQIYGRLCKMKAERSPLLLDVTNSILNIDDFNMFKSPRFGGQRKEYTRRDLFDVSSKTYRYIELSDEMNPFKVKEYRGVRWTSGSSLARALGKSVSSVNIWLQQNQDKTAFDYIDRILGNNSYEDFLKNGFRSLQKVNIADTDYFYSSFENLLKQVGRTGNVGRDIHKLIKSVEWERSVGCIPNEIYRGIDISTILTVGSGVGISPLILNVFIDREHISIKECIDMCLDSDKKYKGIILVNGIKEISSKAGVTQNSVRKAYRKLGTMRAVVDYYFPTNKEYKGIDISEPINYDIIATQLGVNKPALSHFVRVHPDMSIEQCIDYYFDKKRLLEIDEILKSNFTDDCDFDNIKQLIPEKDYNWCWVRSSQLGLVEAKTGGSYTKFTDEEINIILTQRDNGDSWFDIAIRLNKLKCNMDRGVMRSVKSISHFYSVYKKKK